MTVINPTALAALTSPITWNVTDGPNTILENYFTAADTYPAFSITSSGDLSWGPGGNLEPDAYLFRQSAGILEVPGLVVQNALTAAGGLVLGPGVSLTWIPSSGIGINGTLRNLVAANETNAASAGTAGAPPALVKGYLVAMDHTGTTIKIPYYAN